MNVSCIALMASLIATPAFGQSRNEDDTKTANRNEIIVSGRRFVVDHADTATKTDLPIVETPQAISVVDSDFIDRLNLRTIAEALNYTSGVRSQSTGSDTRIDYYQLRGFQQQNFVKDGMVLYNSGAFLSWTTPAEGIARLEVLKGPSSVLYGAGSAGGLVNILSKAPVRYALADVMVGADEYGTAYGSIDLGGPLSDTLAFRSVGLVRRGDTQVKQAEDNRSYGALALGWTPTHTTSLMLRASYTRDRSNRPTGFVPYNGFVTPLADGHKIPIDLFVSDSSIDLYNRDQYEIGYAFKTHMNGALRFVSNGRYGRINLLYAGLYGQFSGNPVFQNGRYYLARGNSRQEAWLDNITIDNHLDAEFHTGSLSHELLGGIDYSHSLTASTSARGSAPLLDIFDPQYNVAIPALGATSTTRQKLGQTGLYIQDRIKWGPFIALLATRHDWLNIFSVAANGALSHGEPGRTTYRAGLSYVTRLGIVPYVSYATSFSPVIGAEEATGRYYRPETGDSWEAGLKYEARGFPLLATASLFNINRDAVLVSNPLPGFPNNQSQLGRVRSRGGEVEVQARPLQTLNLTASLTAFHIENRDGDATTIGKVPTGTAQFTTTAFADYTLPEGSFLPGFGLGFGVRHVGSSYADTANTLVVPAATVFDAAAHYEFGRFRVAANISNLFDKAYVGSCPSAGSCYAANLRRATISLGYNFGERQ